MKILLICDQPLLVESLQGYFEAVEGWSLKNSRAADLVECDTYLPDCVLIDSSSIKVKKDLVTRWLCPVFITSNHDMDGAHKKFFSYGVAGVIVGAALIDIRNVLMFLKGRAIRQAPLNEREEVILGYLQDGASNKKISRDCGLAVTTTKFHVRNICRKLGAKNRTHAALLGRDIIV